MKNIEDIELKKPFVFDIEEYLKKTIKNFDVETFKTSINKIFGHTKYSFSGIHRYGMDSSTDGSVITYDDLKVGNELFWKRPKGAYHYIIDVIRVTHKHNNIIFFKSLTDGLKSYMDCGANELLDKKPNEKALDHLHFYPIEVICPDYVRVRDWYLPQIVKISKK